MNDPATAFFSRDGGYLVRNNITGDIVQISNRNNPNWKPPFQPITTMSLEQLLQSFEEKGVLLSGELLLPPSEVTVLLGACADHDLAVIGIECVRLRGSEVVPDLDLIADCASRTASTWGPYRDEANACSGVFLEALLPDPALYCAMTILSEADWRQLRS